MAVEVVVEVGKVGEKIVEHVVEHVVELEKFAVELEEVVEEQEDIFAEVIKNADVNVKKGAKLNVRVDVKNVNVIKI